MKNIGKIFMVLVAIFAMQMATIAQSTIGYTIADNNTDDPPFNEQQYYSFDVNTGVGTLIAGLGGQGAPEGTAGLKREYEGLASIGSILYGVSQPLAGTVCNNGNDPILGLNSDVRIFRVNGTYPLANGVQNAIGPQIGESCADFGEESSAAYDPVGGFIWAVFSDDLLPATAPRSRLYRISPTTGLATQIGPAAGMTEVNAALPGDDFPYVDGLAILPNGQAYGSDARFTNNPVQDPNNTTGAFDNGGLYRIFLTGVNAGRATWVKYLFRSDLNRDTGAANIGPTIYILAENGFVYNTLSDAVSPTNGPVTITLPGCLGNGTFCGDLEGFDIPQPGVR
jgi:hypothetical protein